MNIDIGYLFAGSLIYLSLIFLVAYVTDKGLIPAKIVRHPVIYTLSLAVYPTAWTIYGNVDFTYRSGFNSLCFYIGATLTFALAPVLLMPILRIVRDHQLTSLADLFAFRYQSQVAGIIVTVLMLIGALPYMALQIVAVTRSAYFLTDSATPHTLAFVYCLMLVIFAILFGARHLTSREKHDGLVVAVAFESLMKIIGVLIICLVAVYAVFGGFSDLNAWIDANPQEVEKLFEPMADGPWLTLTLISAAGVFLLPRQFHMAFAENKDENALYTASWLLPLLLLVLSIGLPIIVWAGNSLETSVPPAYYVLAIAAYSESQWITFIAFITGLSAASAMMIVTTLALSSMCVNHLILPARYPGASINIYKWVLFARRVCILLIVFAGYGFYLLSERNESMAHLGMVSFLAVAQFIPGIVGVLFWSRATKPGFLIGVLGGATVWFAALLIPLLADSSMWPEQLSFMILNTPEGLDRWEFATSTSLCTNSLLFIIFSLLLSQSEQERNAAEACRTTSVVLPFEGSMLHVNSPSDIQRNLNRILGDEAAEIEVKRALIDLDLTYEEEDQSELRRLRSRIEQNLSGLLGPVLARMIVDERLETDHTARSKLIDNIRFIEERLEHSQSRFTDIAEAHDRLRRVHQQILMELPVGVCALDNTPRIILWNRIMEEISDIKSDEVRHKKVDDLPKPWPLLIHEMLDNDIKHISKQQVNVQNQRRWLDIHKAEIESAGGYVLIIEDVTELHELEHELAHTDRLASIGRLAAGVAHEIGNPVTGIACLAQNLQIDSTDDDVNETLSDILEQTRRINTIVQSLVRFSHAGEFIKREAVDVKKCLNEAVTLVGLNRMIQKTDFILDCPPNINIVGDYAQIVQVFVNLLTNAVDASQTGGKIELSSDIVDNCAAVHVKDNGLGISPSIVDKVFDPFVTTKPPGKGTGLGLAMVYRIIHDHDGNVSIQSEEGKGTTVTVVLPLAKIEQVAQEAIVN